MCADQKMSVIVSVLLINITTLQSPESMHILDRVKKIEIFPGNTAIHAGNLLILNSQENTSMAGVSKSLYL